MTLLLDTNAVLWWTKRDSRLGPKARGALERISSNVWVSAASIWELAIKQAAGKLRLPVSAAAAIDQLFAETRFQPLAIQVEHAVAAAALPQHHRDPFDRMLVAQAQIEDLTIVTSDTVFDHYDVKVLDARI